MSDVVYENDPYPAIAVANSLIRIAESYGKKLDPLKIQKLIYYAHGWFLAFKDRPLINEQVLAWKYGPVIRSIYYYFKKFGANKIEGSVEVAEPELRYVPYEDEQVHALLQETWRVYSKYTGLQLSTMSHGEKTPWYKVWNNNKDGLESVVILNDDIKQHFRDILKKSQSSDQG